MEGPHIGVACSCATLDVRRSRALERTVTMFWIVCAVILVLGVYAVRAYRKTYSFFKRQGIPEIDATPILGVMGPIMFKKAGIAEVHGGAYQQLEGHRVGGAFAFTVPAFIIRDPELIRTIAIKDFDHFTDHSQIGISADYDPIVGRNLVALRGQEWRDMRATLSPVFTTSKMKGMFHLIDEIGRQITDYLQQKHQQQQKEKPGELFSMEMKDLFTRFTNDVIANAAFGITVDSLSNPDNEFRKMGNDLVNLKPSRMLIVLGFMLFPKLMMKLNFSFIDNKIKNFFHELVHSNVKAREEQGIVRPDMIHLLMEARRGTLEAADKEDADVDSRGKRMKLTEYDMTAQALVFFLAGFDTIATALTFTSYLIAVHEDVQEKLQREIDSVVGESKEMTYEMLQKMKYLDMVFSESLRMYPPAVATDRSCVRRYVIPASATEPEVVIEKGTSVWLPIYGLHHDPKYFPDPHRFDPERFSDENRARLTPYTYMPFGIGPRVCIGMRFALMEAKVALVQLLRRFNLRVVAKTQVPLVLSKTAQMVGEKGVWLGFEPRSRDTS